MIACEDIGVGDLDVVSLVTASLAGKRVRAELGGEWHVSSALVGLMAKARKCRAADDLLMCAELHPALERVRAEFAECGTDELVGVATGSRPLPERAVALWYGLGTSRWRRSRLRIRRGDPKVVFESLSGAGFPPLSVEIARESFRKTGEVLGPLLVLLSSESHAGAATVDDALPPSVRVGGIPGWAYDLYSREGRGVMQGFLSGESDIARWLARHVPSSRRLPLLGSLLFRVEGGATVGRLVWAIATALRRKVDIECQDLPPQAAQEALALMRLGIEEMNRERQYAL